MDRVKTMTNYKNTFRNVSIALLIIMIIGVIPVMAASGDILWTYQLPDSSDSGLAVDNDGGYYFAGTSSNYIHAFDGAATYDSHYFGSDTQKSVDTVGYDQSRDELYVGLFDGTMAKFTWDATGESLTQQWELSKTSDNILEISYSPYHDIVYYADDGLDALVYMYPNGSDYAAYSGGRYGQIEPHPNGAVMAWNYGTGDIEVLSGTQPNIYTNLTANYSTFGFAVDQSTGDIYIGTDRENSTDQFNTDIYITKYDENYNKEWEKYVYTIDDASQASDPIQVAEDRNILYIPASYETAAIVADTDGNFIERYVSPDNTNRPAGNAYNPIENEFTEIRYDTATGFEGNEGTVSYQLSGTVNDPGGLFPTPIENASVEIYANGTNPIGNNPIQTVYTNTNGEYSTQIEQGTYNIYAHKHGYEEALVESVVIDSNTNQDFLIEEREYYVSGHITNNKSGSPVSNANVTYSVNTIEGTYEYSSLTDSSGYYEIQLPPDEYDVSVTHSSYNTTSKTGVYIGSNSQKDYTLEPIEDSTLYGYVTDTNDNPLDYASVTVGGYETHTNASGYYEIDLLSETYDITVTKAGYNISYLTNYQIDGQVRQDFTLNISQYTLPDGQNPQDVIGDNQVSGYVYDGNATPIEDATIEVNGLSEKTNENGYYSFSLANGTYDFTAFKNGYESDSQNNILVESDTSVDFTLIENQTIVYNTVSGTVTNQEDYAVSGASVTIGAYRDVTNWDGSYSITVPDGVYDIRVEKYNYHTTYKNNTDIANDREIDFTINLIVYEYTLSGYIDNPLGNAVNDAIIKAGDNRAETQANGYYEMAIEQGTYNISINHNDYETKYYNNTVISQDTVINETLEPKRWIEVQAPKWLPLNTTEDYRIMYYVPAYDVEENVTDESTVTSSNTSILSINGSKLDTYMINDTVYVNATYSEFSDSYKIYVADDSMENLHILPSFKWLSTFVGPYSGGLGQPFHWIFVGIVLGSMMTFIVGLYAGLGMIFIMFTFALIVNSISLGFYLALILMLMSIALREMNNS